MTTHHEIILRQKEIKELKTKMKYLFLNRKIDLTDVKTELKVYHLKIKNKEINNFLFELLVERDKKENLNKTFSLHRCKGVIKQHDDRTTKHGFNIRASNKRFKRLRE